MTGILPKYDTLYIGKTIEIPFLPGIKRTSRIIE